MSHRIVVINPNSNESVTEGISRGLDPLRTGSIDIECLTLREGPAGVETQQDIDRVALPICRLIQHEENDTSSFVIACFSDPGLYSAREVTRRPVFGISECGMTTALVLGSNIGVVAILPASIPRHERYFRSMGIWSRVAGERHIGMGVTALENKQRTLERMIEVGSQLRDLDGADVIVLGCAGMARYREELEEILGIPVIDPTQAAVGLALTMTQLGYSRAFAPAVEVPSAK